MRQRNSYNNGHLGLAVRRDVRPAPAAGLTRRKFLCPSPLAKGPSHKNFLRPAHSQPSWPFTICISFLLCILAIGISGCGTSFHFKKLEWAGKEIPAMTAPKQELRVGERLTYEVKWMGIPVGIAVFNVKEIAQINTRDCYHIVASVRSNKILSKIYNVDDEFHSYMDKQNLYSLRFIKRQSEGRYRSHEIVDYDQEAHRGVFKSFLNNSTKEFSIIKCVQDDLSAIYRFRTQDIEIGKMVTMNVNADEKNWVLEIQVLDRGSLKLYNIGNVDAIEVEPTATRTDGKKLRKGRIWIWFSSDENRIPLAAKARAAIVGTVSAVLVDVK